MKRRVRDEKGAVLVVVALVMTSLMVLSAGGVMLFTLYGSHREMQKAADQAAVAGAAALPLLNPGEALSGLPLNTAYNLTAAVGLDVPLKGLSNVPDPRAVACAYGKDSLLPQSSRMIGSFGVTPSGLPGTYCSSSPWADARINPTLNSLSTPLSTCVNGLTTEITGLINTLNSSLASLSCLPLLGCLLSDVTNKVNATVAQLNGVLASVKKLEALSPALLTPEMTVTVTERVRPPMMTFVTGNDGVTMTVTATAQRHLKNAVVLPATPQLLNADLNTALNATKPQIQTAMGGVNTQLNSLMTYWGLTSCQDLLAPGSTLYNDISDLYNPPAAGTYTGHDLLRGAQSAATRAASASGYTVPQLAGEAFLVIRQGPTPSTLSGLLGPVFGTLGLSPTLSDLPIPALDVALVAAHDLEDGNISNPDLIPDVAAARGLFTATLID
ncbi:hypothetical protein BH23ACT12_BH23ACT12_05530 [soil metagenome]